jgi:hypothetical protein
MNVAAPIGTEEFACLTGIHYTKQVFHGVATAGAFQVGRELRLELV